MSSKKLVNFAWDLAEGWSDPVATRSNAMALPLVRADAQSFSDPSQLDLLRSRLRACVALDDFSGALQLSADMLQQAPDDPEAMTAYMHSACVLEKIYLAKMGHLESIPVVCMDDQRLIWLGLDHRSGFVLSQVDGMSSYAEIVEVTGMTRLEAYRILAQLCEQGVISANNS